MNKEEFRKAIAKYSEGKEFVLNPDSNHVSGIVDGVFLNEQKYGMKYCPCRLRPGDKKKDLELLCPCNFVIQQSYVKWGRCWCGLYVKRDFSKVLDGT